MARLERDRPAAANAESALVTACSGKAQHAAEASDDRGAAANPPPEGAVHGLVGRKKPEGDEDQDKENSHG